MKHGSHDASWQNPFPTLAGARLCAVKKQDGRQFAIFTRSHCECGKETPVNVVFGIPWKQLLWKLDVVISDGFIES